MSLEHLNINFNAQTMQYEVMPSESERKAALISDINTIEKTLGKEPMDEQRFEMLMNCSIEFLTDTVNNQSNLLTHKPRSSQPLDGE